MHILVVDDDLLAAEMTGLVLEESGHSVVLAENALEASTQLDADSEIELIISDLNMPLVSGLDFLRELRSQGVVLPFILLTGDEAESLRDSEPGLTDCLLKDEHLEENLPRVVARVAAA